MAEMNNTMPNLMPRTPTFEQYLTDQQLTERAKFEVLMRNGQLAPQPTIFGGKK